MPAAGLRWAIVARPRDLAASPTFKPALDALFTPERRAAFERVTAIPLAKLPRVVVGGFDLGTLYLVELPDEGAARVRDAFARRLVRSARERKPAAGVVTLTGVADDVPQSLVTLGNRIVAFGVGDPTLARIVEAYARGKLKSKRAFEGAALRPLALTPWTHSFLAVAPGPFESRWSAAAGGLLEPATAVWGTLEELGADRARVTLSLAGDYGDANGARAAAEHLRERYLEFATSSFGNVLGLAKGDAIRPNVILGDMALTIRVDTIPSEVASGLRQLTSADPADIFGISIDGDTTPTPTDPPDSR